MITPVPALSNTERQRQFRERNPGYYGRLHAKRRAAIRAGLGVTPPAVEAAAVAAPPPLLLPAPVATTMFTWEWAAVTREAVPVSPPTDARAAGPAEPTGRVNG